MRLNNLLRFFILFCISIAGCTNTNNTPPVIAFPTQTSIPITETPILPNQTITPTSTIYPTITPTPLNTLEPAQITETLQPLLKDPMNCVVPCFWGIIPGKTRLNEVKIFFNKLGFTPFEGINPNSGKYFYSISYDSSTGYDSSVTFHTDNNNLVENMMVTPDIPKPKEGVPREWIAYSPETLIKRYGSPSSVRFTVSSYGIAGLPSNIGINMIMYFDTSDLIVHYSGYGMTPEAFCPLTAPFDFVRLWIGPNPPDTPSFETVPLEKATSLTIEQFTQLMLGDAKKACFAVNAYQ